MSVWQSFARISGVAFQVFFAVLICVGLGWVADHFIPALGSLGLLVGGGLGFCAAIYVMVTGLRAYINSEGPAAAINKEE